MTTAIPRRIAAELGVDEKQVHAAIELLDNGSTVPFIARYRKEATNGLDDAALRTLEERLGYLRELDQRRETIIESIRAQGKLDEQLHQRLVAAETKARLEDLYLPFKPKRRTKAQIAREQGLEPLARQLKADPSLPPETVAAGYVTDAVPDTSAALAGARAILVEEFAEDSDLIGELREMMWTQGRLIARPREGKAAADSKFADYFDFSEAFPTLPSHRILALFRGEKEEVLELSFSATESADQEDLSYQARIADRFDIDNRNRPGDRWLADTVRWAWRTRIITRLEVDIRSRLLDYAQTEAVKVFAGNLRDLLLAAPAGARATMGLDPGFRTGVKVAVIDTTGKVVATDTIYPHVPVNQWDKSINTLATLAKAHHVELIAIGNGTASRETDKLASELIKRHPELSLTKIVVSEAGASVYSASEYASRELPHLDVSLRGAVSIARRLQDPLAELVKIDPKSIGVGQYQHDLAESHLSRSLDAVVEDCVNAVGVDLNTASVPLLRRVSGITPALAENIVSYRDTHGRFHSRRELMNVTRLGPKVFEQCAGFLRIRGGSEPLDASAVHPESYSLVRRMRQSAQVELIGNAPAIAALRPEDFVDDNFGLPTVTDILRELEKPGRDPRPAFKTATFADGVEKVSDLRVGMILEGVVTNVAAFGAFVDIGVHQDGLVHISALSHSYVKDPRDVVKPGQVVKVKVLEVDLPRHRIGLTLRLTEEANTTSVDRTRRQVKSNQPDKSRTAPPLGAMAAALRRAGH